MVVEVASVVLALVLAEIVDVVLDELLRLDCLARSEHVAHALAQLLDSPDVDSLDHEHALLERHVLVVEVLVEVESQPAALQVD